VSEHLSLRPTLPIRTAQSGGIRLEPTSLVSALGLLLAHEIGGDVEWAQCGHCATWFPRGAPGEHVRARTAKFCSAACTRQAQDAKKAKPASAPGEPRACAHCGETFVPKPRANAPQDRCTRPACKTAASRLRQKEGGSK
jgi:hypothetical protein